MKTSQEHRLASGIDDGDYVEFFRAGTHVKGVFQCVSCGELVIARGALTACPICRETIWERGDWMPFQRAGRP
jgi:rubrerythrin